MKCRKKGVEKAVAAAGMKVKHSLEGREIVGQEGKESETQVLEKMYEKNSCHGVFKATFSCA